MNDICRSCFLHLIIGLGLLPAVAAARADEPTPRPIELWPAGAPGATGQTDEDRPAITPYLPSLEKNTGTAILICPGGGFMTRAVDHEGVLIARWFQSRGVAGFILRYRVRPAYTTGESLQDADRGLRYLHAHAADFRIDPDRIGIIGFSAGATLASVAAIRADAGRSDAEDPIDRAPSRVAFQVLAYGSPGLLGIAGGAESSSKKPLDWSAAPPAFLFGTNEDAPAIVKGIAELYAELTRAKVPVEAHFFAHGVHGVGFAQGDPVLGAWPGLMWNWLRAGGFLTKAPRTAIRGIVTIEGEPLARGYVILTPLDNDLAPPVTAYVVNTGEVRGEFSLPASQGPIPGRYRVEVRQDATRWMSNSRDPIMSVMSAKAKSGTITEDERREWIAYARKRDLSPSLTDQRVFRSRNHRNGNDWIVEIKGGAENRLDLAVFTKEG
jgi:acetyl esterase/lipase